MRSMPSQSNKKKGINAMKQKPFIYMNHSPKRKAFTLAEVLITLGIIGVVAAITMPVLISNVQDRVQQKRVENIKQKLSKVTDKMAVQSGLIGYGDTMSFVQEMSKHMKLAKICDNNHISDCWPTKEVILNDDGKTWEIAKTKDAKTLKINKEIRDNWADTVGIVTADGTPMILSYKKDCDFDVDKSGLVFDKGSAMSNSMGCLSGVFDWNGGKNPNKLGNDVLMLGMASGLGNNCAVEIGNLCFSAPFKPTPLTFAECEAQKSALGIKKCCTTSYDDCGNHDYWAGAVKQCGGVSKMPTMAQLAELASQMYVGNPSIGENEYKYGIQYAPNSPVSKALGLTPTFSLWSGEEDDSSHASDRYITTSISGTSSFDRGGHSAQAVCLGD